MDDLIRDKLKQGAWEKNPDVPSMVMYHCWDSSAVIKDDSTKTSQEYVRSGAISGDMAASIMSGTKWLIFAMKPL